MTLSYGENVIFISLSISFYTAVDEVCVSFYCQKLLVFV